MRIYTHHTTPMDLHTVIRRLEGYYYKIHTLVVIVYDSNALEKKFFFFENFLLCDEANDAHFAWLGTSVTIIIIFNVKLSCKTYNLSFVNEL